LDAIAALVACQLSRAAIGRAMETLEAARPLAEALTGHAGAETALARFSEIFGRALFRSEQYQGSIEWCDRALPVAESSRLNDVLAMAMITKGSAMMHVGMTREGVALLRGAVLDARAHGQPIAALRGGVNIAALIADVDPRGSLEWSREGIAEARRLGLSAFAPYHASNLFPAERTGEWEFIPATTAELAEITVDEGTRAYIQDMGRLQDHWRGIDQRARFEAWLASAERDGDPQGMVNWLTLLTDAAFAREEFDVAVRYGLRALEHQFANPQSRFRIGRAALHAGDLASARRVATTLQPSQGGACDADLAALLAGIDAVEGRIPEALERYRNALSTYREMGLPFDVAMTALDMVALVGAGETAVAAAAEEARATFMTLGAKPLLARLDRLLAGQGSHRRVAAAAQKEPSVGATAT
jgi:tetratricopeptide (TPR) repeat protein